MLHWTTGTHMAVEAYWCDGSHSDLY